MMFSALSILILACIECLAKYEFHNNSTFDEARVIKVHVLSGAYDNTIT